ncbi:uncharacterized protein I303_102673 [Kwoniella dejecticola CBS 10117]|uniref:Uncharacterized protein n=1 Tax=Kwoniella dejecticola CBS 10117 TaxID=1296121 RepID=A0A1A6A9D6_9TREE|nr:uncharacterized protein I303_02688 [Kwoniella dejecticola CBS 10117]OBR86677.1 hypothetical protein I303_02688 [Kwoniella dejecticola CBS 10117]
MSSPSSPRSDYSLLSSMEVLSISSGAESSRRASSASQLLYPSSCDSLPSSDEYEHVFLPQPQHPARDQEASSLSLSSMEASISSCATNDASNQALGGKSSSAKRRERKKKLVAGEKERAAMGIPSNRTWGSSASSASASSNPTSHEDSSNMPFTPKGKQPFRSTLLEQTPIAGPSTPRPTSTFSMNTEESSARSAGEVEVSEGERVSVKRKTRRGGKKARRRAENKGLAIEASEVDEELDFLTDIDGRTTSPTSSAQTSRSGTPVRVIVETMSEYSADGASHILDEEEDEVDGELSPMESELGTPPSKRYGGSVMSAEDAASSIDSFLSDPRNFMTIKANKLRLWQSLCIELGLVTLAGDELPDLPTIVCVPTPPRPRETTPEPIGPFVPKKHPLPETLTQARKLLKDHAHVNLVDYLEARKFCPPAYVGAYQGLLYPSTSAMKRYTRHQGKFAEKLVIRAEWLEPLMKDFGVKKYKGMA